MTSTSFFNHAEYHKALKGWLADCYLESEDIFYLEQGLAKVAYWGAQYFLKLLQDKKIFINANSYDIDEIKEKLQLLSNYEQQLNSLLEILTRLQLIISPSQHVYQCLQPKNSDLEQLLAEEELLLTTYPQLQININFLHKLLKNYFLILSGKENFLNIFFVNGSFEIFLIMEADTFYISGKQ